MKMNRAVVTGGAGFIGSHIVDELLSRGTETYVIDDLSNGSVENIRSHKSNKLLHFIKGDVKDADRLLRGVGRIDVVFHEAAYINGTQSVARPQLAHEINVNRSLDMMNCCMKRDVGKFVFASSAAIYGEEPKNRLSVEGVNERPLTPYGASKAAVEVYLGTYWEAYGFKSTALRYFNVYGPRQKSDSESGVISIFVDKARRGARPTVYGDGKQTRDFVHVKDVVQANMLAAQATKKSFGQAFNVGSGRSTSVMQLLEIIGKAAGKQMRPKFAVQRAGDSMFSKASLVKTRSVLGFDPRVSLEDGLKEMVDVEVA